VQQMGRIYRSAELVIAWLGEAGDDSDFLLDLLLAIAATRHKSSGGGENCSQPPSVGQDTGLIAKLAAFMCEWFDEDNALELNDANSLPALAEDENRRLGHATTKLLRRSWWSRLWVVQEVLLAREVLYQCGQKKLFHEDLASFKAVWTVLLTAPEADILDSFELLEAFSMLFDHRPAQALPSGSNSSVGDPVWHGGPGYRIGNAGASDASWSDDECYDTDSDAYWSDEEGYDTEAQGANNIDDGKTEDVNGFGDGHDESSGDSEDAESDSNHNEEDGYDESDDEESSWDDEDAESDSNNNEEADNDESGDEESSANSEDSESDRKNNEGTKTPSNLTRLLCSFYKRQTTNPVDKVYGLLGLADEPDKYGAPDYSKPYTSVFSDVAKTIIREDGNLNLLVVAGIGDSHPSRTRGLPSWAPDWTTRRYNASYLESEVKGWRACGDREVEQDYRFLPGSPEILVAAGVLVDVISSRSSVLDEASERQLLRPEALIRDGTAVMYVNGGETRLEAYVSALLCYPSARSAGDSDSEFADITADYALRFLPRVGERAGARMDEQIIQELVEIRLG